MILPKTITFKEYDEMYKFLDQEYNRLIIHDDVIEKNPDIIEFKEFQYPKTVVALSNSFAKHNSGVDLEAIPFEGLFVIYHRQEEYQPNKVETYKKAFVQSFLEMRAEKKLISWT